MIQPLTRLAGPMVQSSLSWFIRRPITRNGTNAIKSWTMSSIKPPNSCLNTCNKSHFSPSVSSMCGIIMTPCQSSFPESNIILSHLFLCANECFRILHRLSQQFTCFMLGAIPPVRHLEKSPFSMENFCITRPGKHTKNYGKIHHC